MEFKIDGVIVTSNIDDLTVEEAQKYIDYVKNRVVGPLKAIEVNLCDDGKIDVNYMLQGEKFERIRRITGTRIAVCSQAV